MTNLTQEYLKSLISYNLLTGIFVWKTRPLDSFATTRAGKIWNTRFANKTAGTTHGGNGYLQIKINGESCLAHRLAWLYVHGSMPVDQIDHISHDRLDNRLVNIRACTRTDNQKNKSMDKRNSSGFTGVSWFKRGSKWRADIRVNGKLKYLGSFSDIKDAINARKLANAKYNYHSNHGLA